MELDPKEREFYDEVINELMNSDCVIFEEDSRYPLGYFKLTEKGYDHIYL